MACAKCSCGPVIVRPEVNLDGVTLDLPDREFLPLCDVQADGTAVPFLRRYTVDPGGAVTVFNSTLDGTTPYTPTGTVGLCNPDSETDPEIDRIGQVLCDVAADGSSVSFLRSWTIDNATGTASAPIDTALDGSTPHTVTGTVEACGGGDAACCPNAEIQPLCDVAADGTSVPFLRRYTIPAEGAVTFVDTTLDGTTPYTPTGTVGVCAGSTPECLRCQDHILCDDGADTDTIPDGAGSGLLTNGVTWSTTSPQVDFSDTPDGWFQIMDPSTVTFDQPVTVRFQVAANGPCATLPAGVELVELNPSHTYDPATRQFCSNTADLVQRSTFRTVGAVTSLEFASPPTGDAAAFMGGFVVTVQHEGATFLRRLCRDCDGLLVSATDTLLDGTTSYTPTGTVGVCGPTEQPDPEPEPCRDSSVLLVCDVPQDGAPTATVTDTAPGPFEDQPGTEPVAGGAAALWSGGVLSIPPDSAPPPDGTAQFLRTLAATVQAARPGCDTGTATVTARVRAEREGPDPGCGGTGFLRLLLNGTLLDQHGVTPASVPVGTVVELVVTAQVPAADVAAGNVALYSAFETYHRSPASCPGGSDPDGARVGGWTLDQSSVEVVFDQAGCAQQILATVVSDCETGQVQSTTYTTIGGDPYTPTGEIGQCTTVGSAPAEECLRCQDLILCDADGTPATIVGDEVATATLPNGITWTSRVNQPAPSDIENADGSWWNSVYSFPNPVVGPQTWTFSRPVWAEFSVYVQFSVSGGTQNQVELPPGVEPVSLPTGFTYDPGTRVLTVDATADQTCTNLTNPTQATSARFRTTAPVEAFTLEFLGARIASCGQFGNWAFGAFVITPAPVTFVRTICRDCDGAEVSREDNTLDGDPYTPIAVVGACTAGSSQAGCTRQIKERCGCDDVNGDGSLINRYVELWAVDPCEELTPELRGTFLDGDFEQPYTPVNPVDCPAGVDDAASPLFTGARNITGTAAQNLVADHPGLQSVTLSVLAGAALATMTEGAAVPFPAGTSHTWSVVKDDHDSVLPAAAFAGADAATNYLLVYTWKN